MPRTIDPALQPLRETVRSGAHNRPGIYRMVGGAGAIIYVGKSKRVRTRLMGYFRAKPNQKAWKIVRDAANIEWEYAPSEFASLLRELELIKRYRPPYNVKQKRDALYCFLKITAGPAPRIQVVRRVRDDGARYFGPLRGGQRIVEGVKELNDALRLRDCQNSTPMRFADQADFFGMDHTPGCARQELDRCAAPCAAGCTADGYNRRLAEAEEFLRGRNERPFEVLYEKMDRAIRAMAYEHAALTQQRIERLATLREEFRHLQASSRNLSFLYAVPGYEGEDVVYAIRAGSIRDRYPAPRTRRERSSLLREAAIHFERPETVSEVTTPKRVEELILVSHWFRTRPKELERTYPQKHWDRLPLAGEFAQEKVA